MRLCLLLFFVCLLSCTECAKILGVFPFPAHSHFTLGNKLVLELASRGHEVTVITPYPQKTPVKGLRDISVEEIIPAIEELKKSFFRKNTKSVFVNLPWVLQLGHTVTELTLSSKNVQKLLQSQETFDLVITELFVSEAFIGLGTYYDCPVTVPAPMVASSWTNFLIGNPESSSFSPNLLSDFGSRMNLWERFWNALYDAYTLIYMNLVNLPRQAEILAKHVPGSPNLYDNIYNVSLMLINSHPSFSDPTPLVPAMIEIGGYHVSPPKSLPKDIQDFMDKAEDGVVYFSMGSNLKSADFPKEIRKAILNSFSKIKQKVLWKFEDDLPDKPDNLKIAKWLPQADILAHSNMRAFISHGGLLSTIETIYHGVPVIGIPVFGDQKMNIVNAERKGYAISLPREDLTEERLTWALNEILNNPKYRENAKRRSQLLHDQPVKPMDSAMYWIEYVIRNNGAPHLRVAGLDLAWYQRSLVDIIVILTVITIVLFFIFYEIFKHILRFFRSKNIKKNITKSKKNK